MPPVEWKSFQRDRTRSRRSRRRRHPVTAPALPLVTQLFLQTPRKARERTAIYALHGWLESRRLPLSQLTVGLFQRFLTCPLGIRVIRKTSRLYCARLRNYLQYLRDRGLISFNPERFRRLTKPLPALAREYLASLAPTHRPSTCDGYATALRHFYTWLDDCELTLERLTRREITLWFQDMHAAGHASVTRHNTLLKIRAYLYWANERLVLQTAPDELIRTSDLPKLPRYLPRPLTAEADRELQRRLTALDDPRAWALLLMRRTGLRMSELLDLEYHCSRLDDRRPLLKVPLGKMNNERLVPLDSEAVDLIRRLQSVGPRPRPRLLYAKRGPRQNYHALVPVLHAVGRDLPDPAPLTSHRLRHTYATELLSAGMSLVGVMRLLGHRDHRMTLRYAAITPETVGDEYQKALAQLATKYRLPLPTPSPPENTNDPNQVLERLAHWVRQHSTSPTAPRALLRRIERLQRDVRRLAKPSAKKPVKK